MSYWNEQWINLIFFALVSLIISVIDLKYRKIPNILSIGGVFAALGIHLLLKNDQLVFFLLAALCGFMLYCLVWFFSGKKIGLGDAKYAAFIGISLGPLLFLLSTMIAGLLSILFFLVYFIVKIGDIKRDKNLRIPFAPFMTAGAYAAVIIKVLGLLDVPGFV